MKDLKKVSDITTQLPVKSHTFCTETFVVEEDVVDLEMIMCRILINDIDDH